MTAAPTPAQDQQAERGARRRRRLVLGAVMLLLALPAAVAVEEAVTFQLRNGNNGALVAAGLHREYLLHVPPQVDRRRLLPLVISLHGAGGWPVMQRDVSRWDALADREGFLVVYPAGMDTPGPRIWHEEAGPEQARDLAFLAGLVDELAARYPIDRTRVYANGLSNGGGMSFVLSCRLADRIAAVGMVGAALIVPASWCAGGPAMPVIAFHGTADEMAPYHGGSSWAVPAGLPDVPSFLGAWARRNGCASRPTRTRIAADVERRAYPGCTDGADVELYTVYGGGHTWPGGGPLPEWFLGRTTRTIDATALMWAFFQAHPLRRR